MKPSNAETFKKIHESAPIFQGARRSDIAMQIRCKMAEKGLRNVDIAARLGVSEANVSRWLKGNQNLSLDTLYQLSDAVEEPLNIVVGNLEQAALVDAATEETYVAYSVEATVSVHEDCMPSLDDGACGGSNVFQIAAYAQMRTQARKVEPKNFSVAQSESGIGDYRDYEELKRAK